MRALFLSTIGLTVMLVGVAIGVWVDEDLSTPFLVIGGFSFVGLSYRAIFGHAAAEGEGLLYSAGRIAFGVIAIVAVIAALIFMRLRKRGADDDTLEDVSPYDEAPLDEPTLSDEPTP